LIENFSRTYETHLRNRTNPVDVFSTKCRIVLHHANTSLLASKRKDLLSTRRWYPQLVHKETTCSCRFARSSPEMDLIETIRAPSPASELIPQPASSVGSVTQSRLPFTSCSFTWTRESGYCPKWRLFGQVLRVSFSMLVARVQSSRRAMPTGSNMALFSIPCILVPSRHNAASLLRRHFCSECSEYHGRTRFPRLASRCPPAAQYASSTAE
jgi:hypothetical protein